MKKNNYFQPVMKLHELKSGRIMLEASSGGTPQSKGGIDQLQDSKVWNDDEY